MSFANQVAVITGGSSGIGLEMAKELTRRQCAVGLVARRLDRLEAAAAEIKAMGGKVAFATADVANRQQTLDAIANVRSQLGPVDLLIANSGVSIPTLIEPVNLTDIEQMFQVNTLGVIYAVAAVLPEMLQRRSGHLVAVSSLGSYAGIPGDSGYCASKAAVNIYMDGLRVHLLDRGIRVTTVCPGFVHTPMTAVNKFSMPFVLTAAQAAQKIIGAVERRKKVFNFPWQTAMMVRWARRIPDWLLLRFCRKGMEERQERHGKTVSQ